MSNNNMSSMLVDSQEHFVEEMQEISSSSKRAATANGAAAAAVNPFNLTPGQQVKVGRETRMLFNPENVLNRNALNENYGLQLPLIEKKEKLKVKIKKKKERENIFGILDFLIVVLETPKMSTHIITGSTVEHLSTLPLVYRRNPTVRKSQFLSNLDDSLVISNLIDLVDSTGCGSERVQAWHTQSDRAWSHSTHSQDHVRSVSDQESTWRGEVCRERSVRKRAKIQKQR